MCGERGENNRRRQQRESNAGGTACRRRRGGRAETLPKSGLEVMDCPGHFGKAINQAGKGGEK